MYYYIKNKVEINLPYFLYKVFAKSPSIIYNIYC